MVPGSAVDLRAMDPSDTGGLPNGVGKAEASALLDRKVDELGELQDRFHADGRHRVLFVLQAMDTAGKDSTIRTVFRGTNPLGLFAHSFQAPSPTEAAHDYLWRAHRLVPADGEIVVFNRSHYEDVLVVRVRDLVPESRWRKRYRHIRDFERMLVDEGTTIRKFFLHISPEHQAERLQKRIDDPGKHWKLDPSDLGERTRWYDYVAAYEEAIAETATDDAPWYVIPSDRRWYRKLAVANLVVDAVAGLDLRLPAPPEGIGELEIPELRDDGPMDRGASGRRPR
jgi:PPK2 family polyphosphate:nucleotide phosphotransferase